MPLHRTNETIHTGQPLRTSRGYEVNGQWYFELRDGGQKGPFESEEEMLAELNEFIKCHKLMNYELMNQ